MTTCEPGTAGTLFAVVEVTNSADTAGSYATVVFTDSSGTVLDEGPVAQEGLAADETRTAEVPSIEPAPADGFQCAIEDARRLD